MSLFLCVVVVVGASGGCVSCSDGGRGIRHIVFDGSVPLLVIIKHLVWFGLVWFGLVWFGLVWFGLAWFGLVWFVPS